ncbi:hypothetical protein D9M71_523140 [compost metagenome]
MLVLVEPGGQLDGVLLGLGADGLRRQQLYFAAVEQLQDAFDLEGGRAAGEFAFLAALLDRQVGNGVVTEELPRLAGEGLDVVRQVIVFQGDLLGTQGQVRRGASFEGGDREQGFAALDFDSADFHSYLRTGVIAGRAIAGTPSDRRCAGPGRCSARFRRLCCRA